MTNVNAVRVNPVSDDVIEAAFASTDRSSRREAMNRLADQLDERDETVEHFANLLEGRLATPTELARIAKENNLPWSGQIGLDEEKAMSFINRALCWAQVQERNEDGFQLKEVTVKGARVFYGKTQWSGDKSSIRWTVEVLDYVTEKFNEWSANNAK